MISEKLKSQFFGGSPADEATKSIRQELDQVDRRLGLGQKLLVIKQSGGFQEFLAEVEKLREHIRDSMETYRGPNSGLRVLQGEAIALSRILGLMRATENGLGALEARRKTLLDHLAQFK